MRSYSHRNHQGGHVSRSAIGVVPTLVVRKQLRAASRLFDHNLDRLRDEGFSFEKACKALLENDNNFQHALQALNAEVEERRALESDDESISSDESDDEEDDDSDVESDDEDEQLNEAIARSLADPSPQRHNDQDEQLNEAIARSLADPSPQRHNDQEYRFMLALAERLQLAAVLKHSRLDQ